MKHHEGTFHAYQNTELFYQTWQSDGASRGTLIIVHGFGEHSGRYPNLVSGLVPLGYSIYAFDLRGHGRSPGQRCHIDNWNEYREDLRCFLQLVRAAEPNKPVILYGHSLGVIIVLDYIERASAGLNGIILSGPPFESSRDVSAYKIILARLLSGIVPSFSLPVALDVTALSRNPGVVRAYQTDPLVQGMASVRWGTEYMNAIEYTEAHAADVKLPILIICGESDRLGSPSHSRIFYENVTFPDKELQLYMGYYHELHNDVGWERVVQDVSEWIARHM